MVRTIKYHTIKDNKGQSTIEYIVLVTAVIAIIILFMTGQNSIFGNKMTNTYCTTVEGIAEKAGTLSETHNSQAGNQAASIVEVDVLKNLF